MPKKNDALEPVQPTPESTPKLKPTKVAKAAKPDVKPAAKSTDAKPATTPIAALSAAVSSKALNIKAIAVKVGAVLVGVLALVVIVFGVLIYVYKSESQVVSVVSMILPYPVEQVNGSFVSYHEYLFEVDANKRAYQNNAKLNNQPAVDFNSAEGKKLVTEIKQHALDKLKSDAVVAQLARQKKVTVSDKEVGELVDELYKRYGGKETLLKTLKDIYAWDLNDLKKVVRKQLLAQKLQEKVAADPAIDGEAKTKAQDVLNKVKGGGDFAALAKQYSQASDASAGGDLGSFTKGQLDEELQKAVDATQAGQVSDLVKTKYGYEIVKVNEKTGDTAKAQHILIKTVDFNDYFDEQLKKAKVKIFVKV